MIKHKNEAKATTERLKKMKWKKDVWLYKIPDTGPAKNPFDVVGVIKWKPNAIEFKYCDTKKMPDIYWAFKKLEPHQVTNLNNFRLAWWKSTVIVFHNETKQYIEFDFEDIYDVLWEEIERFYILLDKNAK